MCSDNSKKLGAVYIIENIKNGKKYIGQSIRYKERYKYHLKLLRLNNHFNKKLQDDYNEFRRSFF